jgi:ectoine hydroxylase-related dioxygenase (phytanoyl-CoA dioxygenase family)
MTSTIINFSRKWSEQIKCEGFAVWPAFADEETIATLIGALEAEHDSEAARRGASGVYAMRNLLSIRAVRDFAASPKVCAALSPVLGQSFHAVRGILFDKTPGANWKVGWHQDLSIAVKNRIEVPGFAPWSQKAGVWHVQPPREVLENMLTLRLHFDECDEANGPLRVVPASHCNGKLAPDEINALRARNGQVICTCPRGGALWMRPLLLHASSPATSPRHRRVVHIEFACGELPGGLEWIA